MSRWMTSHIIAWCGVCEWGASAETPTAADERRVIRQAVAHQRIHRDGVALERGQFGALPRPVPVSPEDK